MPIYKFGYVIKQRREELGYTQEDLAEGICSVPTLSRIEMENDYQQKTILKCSYSDLVSQNQFSITMLMNAHYFFMS